MNYEFTNLQIYKTIRHKTVRHKTKTSINFTTLNIEH